MSRSSPVVATVACLGLLFGCGSSESPASSAARTNSIPETTISIVTTAPTTSTSTPTATSAHLLAGRPMTDCTVQSEAPVTGTARALCGILEVPEDRTDPSGRTIGLRVAVVPAEADAAEPDAFFALAG